MMETSLFLAVGAGTLAFVLLSYERIPAMLVLLGVGVVSAVAWEPTLMQELAQLSFHPRLPEFALTQLGWEDLVTGVVVLGLPQVSLTLGNAIIGSVEENNALFPNHPLTVKAVAIDHGLMNLVGTSLGGVPMCHGTGGMAAHVRFGARTGGALVILGGIVLFTGLFLVDSVATLFKLFPRALLGVILMFGGLELAAGARWNGGKDQAERCEGQAGQHQAGDEQRHAGHAQPQPEESHHHRDRRGHDREKGPHQHLPQQ